MSSSNDKFLYHLKIHRKKYQIIISGVLLLTASLISLIRVLHPLRSLSFLSFGLDTTRVIGYGIQLLDLGSLNQFASLRLTVPAIIAAFATIPILDIISAAAIVYGFMSIVGVFTTYLLARVSTKSPIAAGLSSLIYVALTKVMQLNDSHVVIVLWIPLMLTILAHAYHQRSISMISKLCIGLLIILGVFSYPALMLYASVGLGLLFLLINHTKLWNTIAKILLSWSLLASVLLIIFFKLGYSGDLSWRNFANMTIGFYRITPKDFSTMSISLLGLAVVITLANTKAYKKVIHQKLTKILEPAIALMTFLTGMYYAISNLIIYITNSSNSKLIIPQIIFSLVAIGVAPLILKPTRAENQLMKYAGAIISAWPFILVYSIIPVLGGRIYAVRTLLASVLLGFLIARHKNLLYTLAVLLVVIPVWISRLGTNRLETMENVHIHVPKLALWLRTLPEHSRVIYHHAYTYSNKLAPHELPYTQYFNPTVIEFDEYQDFYACPLSKSYECLDSFIRLANTYNIKYFVNIGKCDGYGCDVIRNHAMRIYDPPGAEVFYVSPQSINSITVERENTKQLSSTY